MYVTKSTGTERSYCVELLLEDVPGGGNVARADLKTSATEVLEGALLGKDANGLYHVVKTAKIVSGGTSSVPRLNKNHLFKVGQKISDGLVALDIATLTEGADYDTITFTSGVLSVYSEGTVLYEVESEDTDGGTPATASVVGTVGSNLTVTVPASTTVANFNGLKLVISQNGSDNLAVSYSNGTLTLALANTTASKNNAATIQTAIRALGLVAVGVSLAAVTVAGTSWDGAQTGAVLTTPSTTFANGVSVATKAPKYAPVGVSTHSISIAAGNTGSGICVRGRVRESGMSSFVNTYLKSLLPLILFV